MYPMYQREQPFNAQTHLTRILLKASKWMRYGFKSTLSCSKRMYLNNYIAFPISNEMFGGLTSKSKLPQECEFTLFAGEKNNMSLSSSLL